MINSQSSRISIIGTGYVGLTTGICLAHLGHSVQCVDTDPKKIALLQAGEIPIYEPGLQELLLDAINQGLVSFSTVAQKSLVDTDFVFLCLPTPTLPNGEADISAVIDFVKENSSHFRPGSIIINKSTVPVSTAHTLKDLLQREDIDVVSNPEFLREGKAVEDFLKPSRIVIGCNSSDSGEKIANLYSKIDTEFLITDWSSAETIKYMANAFLATKLSFVNQIAGFCSHAKANVRDVLSGLALDPRIGSEFLQPGPGWGGSCFPKDTKAVAAVGRSIGYPMTLVEEAFRSNTEHMENMVALIATHAKRISSETIRIGFLGLSFKADTDDVRESPAVFICRELVRLGFEIKIYDPLAADVPDLINFRVAQLELALQDSEILVIGTEWSHFQALTPETCRNYMKGRTIIDLRFILDANLFAGSEFMVVRYGSNSTDI